MRSGRAVEVTRTVAGRAAVFAMLLIVAMFMFADGAVVTAAPIARASAVSAFRTHLFPFGCDSIAEFWLW